jgi:hypothetical protein
MQANRGVSKERGAWFAAGIKTLPRDELKKKVFVV